MQIITRVRLLLPHDDDKESDEPGPNVFVVCDADTNDYERVGGPWTFVSVQIDVYEAEKAAGVLELDDALPELWDKLNTDQSFTEGQRKCLTRTRATPLPHAAAADDDEGTTYCLYWRKSLPAVLTHEEAHCQMMLPARIQRVMDVEHPGIGRLLSATEDLDNAQLTSSVDQQERFIPFLAEYARFMHGGTKKVECVPALRRFMEGYGCIIFPDVHVIVDPETADLNGEEDPHVAALDATTDAANTAARRSVPFPPNLEDVLRAMEDRYAGNGEVDAGDGADDTEPAEQAAIDNRTLITPVTWPPRIAHRMVRVGSSAGRQTKIAPTSSAQTLLWARRRADRRRSSFATTAPCMIRTRRRSKYSRGASRGKRTVSPGHLGPPPQPVRAPLARAEYHQSARLPCHRSAKGVRPGQHPRRAPSCWSRGRSLWPSGSSVSRV